MSFILLVCVVILCLDVGSTWTKAALITPEGELVRTGQHPTTPPEVLHGIDALRAEVGDGEILACSSAGGGLRLAVVGQERVVSAEAGYRVALSAGAKIVHVSAGPVDVKTLRATKPDLILLVGGTDGGDQSVLLHNAKKLANVAVPIVLAGNVEAQPEALELLRKRTVVACPNVLPDVGQLAPEPARRAIRAAFLQHVIGGKGLSRGPRFRQLVRAVTPDAVLAGVSRLAAQDREGAVLVVDVGGATTDVYSAVSTADSEGLERTVALPPDRRTVEGDLGMRWSAPGVVKEALAERLTTEDLTEEARHRAENVGWLPDDPAVDVRLASFAAILAVRRHLRQVDGQLGPHGAGLLVLSGGVFRHTPDITPIVETLRADPVLRPVLRTAEITVDRDYVLAPVGLLAESGRLEAADRLAKRLG